MVAIILWEHASGSPKNTDPRYYLLQVHLISSPLSFCDLCWLLGSSIVNDISIHLILHRGARAQTLED